MTHLTEETILAVRDREHVTDEALAHVARCARCAQALKDARARAQAVEQALTALTLPVSAKEDLAGMIPIGRGHRTAIRETASASSRTLRWLGRAAVLVLFGAGALSALPGPFSGWIPRMFTEAPAVQTTTEPAAPAAEQVGGRMAVAAGPLIVHLDMVPPGTLIDVRRSIEANVGVLAGAGSEFSYGSREVRASVAAGPVTVELPEGVVPATLIVNGGTYLVMQATGLEVSGPRSAAAGEESLVTFQVPN